MAERAEELLQECHAAVEQNDKEQLRVALAEAMSHCSTVALGTSMKRSSAIAASSKALVDTVVALLSSPAEHMAADTATAADLKTKISSLVAAIQTAAGTQGATAEAGQENAGGASGGDEEGVYDNFSAQHQDEGIYERFNQRLSTQRPSNLSNKHSAHSIEFGLPRNEAGADSSDDEDDGAYDDLGPAPGNSSDSSSSDHEQEGEDRLQGSSSSSSSTSTGKDGGRERSYTLHRTLTIDPGDGNARVTPALSPDVEYHVEVVESEIERLYDAAEVWDLRSMAVAAKALVRECMLCTVCCVLCTVYCVLCAVGAFDLWFDFFLPICFDCRVCVCVCVCSSRRFPLFASLLARSKICRQISSGRVG